MERYVQCGTYSVVDGGSVRTLWCAQCRAYGVVRTVVRTEWSGTYGAVRTVQ